MTAKCPLFPMILVQTLLLVWFGFIVAHCGHVDPTVGSTSPSQVDTSAQTSPSIVTSTISNDTELGVGQENQRYELVADEASANQLNSMIGTENVIKSASPRVQRRMRILMKELENIEASTWLRDTEVYNDFWIWTLSALMRNYYSNRRFDVEFVHEIEQFLHKRQVRVKTFVSLHTLWKCVHDLMMDCLRWEKTMSDLYEGNEVIDPVGYNRYMDNLESLFRHKNDKLLYEYHEYRKFVNEPHRLMLMKRFTSLEGLDDFIPYQSDSDSDTDSDANDLFKIEDYINLDTATGKIVAN